MASSNLWKLVKISVRLGVPGALVYVTTQEGLWGTAEESIRFYQKVTESLPGKEVIITDDQEKQLKATIEKLRVWSDPNHVPLTERWNSGVIKTVKFLDSLPDYLTGDDSPIKAIEEKAKKFIS